MKKLALVLVVLLFASVASAQVISNPTPNARMDGLGVANWQIEDDFNIWINPAQISNYKSGIYGELGTTTGADSGPEVNDLATGQYGGLHLDTAFGTWGLWLGRPGPGTRVAFDALGLDVDGDGTPDTLADFFEVLPEANRFDLFYALAGMPVGFYLSYASESEENAFTKDGTETNVGVGALLMDGALDLALNITSASYEDEEADSEEDISGWAILARHKGEVALGRLITTGRIVSFGLDEADVDTLEVGVDTALNAKPDENTLVVAAVGVLSQTASDDVVDTSRIAIPLNLAVEHQTFKKVKTRFGVAKAIYDATSDDIAETDTVADGPATVSAGFGWMIHDNIVLDAVVNQDVLFTGSYLVSGVPETLSSKISATYRFQ